MTASPGFIEFLQEVLAPLGPIAVRRMFGGAGIYCDSQVFAFVDDDTLYLKTDEAGRRAFEAEGAGPFRYMTKHGPGELISYWQAPERLLDDPEEMVAWARRALAVAKASAAQKKATRSARSPAKPATKTTRPRS
jgi:DNA transformation protein